jgi:hypothetical protein
LKSSLDPEIEGNRKNIYKAGEGAGKSGSFMFFCHNNQFLIKTNKTFISRVSYLRVFCMLFTNEIKKNRKKVFDHIRP